MVQILYGDIVAENIRKKVAADVVQFEKKYQRTPHLAVVLSFDNVASQIYVSKKIQACREVGIRSTAITTPHSTKEKLIETIHGLNNNPDIDAILIQFPLHPNIDTHTITDVLDPNKDVDGFSSANLGKLVQGRTDGILPCTPKGIIELLRFYNISVEGQHIAIIGRSMIVGRPLSLLLSNNAPVIGNATVSLLHSRTPNISTITQKADIVISATGTPNLVTGDMIKENAIIIDVGINRIQLPNGKTRIIGDVDFESVSKKASAITPVPKGIGPMTVACLLENTLLTATLCAEK